MDDKQLEQFAFANLPTQNCPITKAPIRDAAVMHRDLSDWWPSKLLDMRDDRLANIVIVEREARERYYSKLKNMYVVLAFSGGLDSATVLHWCIRIFGGVSCLLFDYGQRHRIELECAKAYIDKLNQSQNVSISSSVIDMTVINTLADSSLTRENEIVPRNNSIEEMGKAIPNTFVPGRNIYFMTALAQRAYMHGGRHIAMGVNALDYSGYPDCRPEFVESMRQSLSIGVYNGIDLAVHTPLMRLNKKQIIRLGLELGVEYADTHSCYNGVPGGCGECDSCLLRRNAFAELGMKDPAMVKHHR